MTQQDVGGPVTAEGEDSVFAGVGWGMSPLCRVLSLLVFEEADSEKGQAVRNGQRKGHVGWRQSLAPEAKLKV